MVAATNRNLAERVAAGEFREDLLYRLRVIHIHVPPLRDRRADVRAAGRAFRARAAARRWCSRPQALELLERYRWPGNVRELQNIVEHAIWQSDDADVIGAGRCRARFAQTEPLVQTGERRRQIADELYDALVNGGCSFWAHVHPLFLARDITRHDIGSWSGAGCARRRGSYRALLTLFGMEPQDYQQVPQLPVRARMQGGLPGVPQRRSRRGTEASDARPRCCRSSGEPPKPRLPVVCS